VRSSVRFKYFTFPIPNPEVLKLRSIIDVDEISDDLKLKVSVGTKMAREVKISPNSKEGIYVHLCWIYLWCFTLGLQDEKENIFRLNQLC